MKTTLAVLGLIGLAALLPAADAPKAPDNTPPAGFTALFNGKDLSGWQGAIRIDQRAKLSPKQLAERQQKANEVVKKHWTVTKEGILAHDGKGGVNLGTVKDYGNVELYLDWKIAEKGDSGVYLRGNPQVQIWDSDRTAGARGLDKGSGSGGLWNNSKNPKRPLKKADKPVGEWNTFRIIMKGDRVTVYLNGALVVDNTPLENIWERGKPLPATGAIELQTHNDPIWFKNVYVKELPE
jgi:Domain of Unknown Function (DUF1080)